MSAGADLGRRLREGDVTAAPAALNLLESAAPEDVTEGRALLAAVSPKALGHEPRGHVVGVTGPPGAGKSTLLSAFVRHLRGSGYESVAVLAVDPSSRRSGGSLLGDRARIDFDPADSGVFIRSTAAGERLGGIAAGTRAAAQALSVAFEIVLIETVGVGQAEIEVADVVDTVIVVVQPGSGDTLQFIKSGIMEIPDLLVVTKADLGELALRTRRDLTAALRSLGSAKTPVLAVSALPPFPGLDALAQELEQRGPRRDGLASHLQRLRRAGAVRWFATEHGERGLRAIGGRRAAERTVGQLSGELSEADYVDALERALEAARSKT